MSIIGAAPWLVAKPASPSQWDDEFEGTGLDTSAWTRVTGASIATTPDKPPLDPYATFVSTHYENVGRHRPGWYYRQPVSSYGVGGYSLTTEGIYRPLTSLPTNCFIWMRATRSDRSNNNNDGDGELWMTLYRSASPADASYLGLNSFLNRPGVVYAKTTTAAPSFTNLGVIENYFSKANPCEYLGIQKIGNTYHGWCASYTGNWVHLGSQAHVAGFDSVVISFNNQTTSAPGPMTMGIDFFRVLSGIQIP